MQKNRKRNVSISVLWLIKAEEQLKKTPQKTLIWHLFMFLWKLNLSGCSQIVFPKIAAKSSQASHPLGNHGSLGIESGACPHKTEHFLLPTLSLAAIISSEIFSSGKTKCWIGLWNSFSRIMWWIKQQILKRLSWPVLFMTSLNVYNKHAIATGNPLFWLYFLPSWNSWRLSSGYSFCFFNDFSVTTKTS